MTHSLAATASRGIAAVSVLILSRETCQVRLVPSCLSHNHEFGDGERLGEIPRGGGGCGGGLKEGWDDPPPPFTGFDARETNVDCRVPLIISSMSDLPQRSQRCHS